VTKGRTHSRRTGIPRNPAESRPNLLRMALSYLRIEPQVVVVRRWPRQVQRVPRTEIDRFAVLKTKGEEGVSSPRLGIREPHHYLAMLMKDGSSMRVPGKQPDPAAEALSLNNQLHQ
jgi:hypothetical protein